jgi:hypothetical protein
MNDLSTRSWTFVLAGGGLTVLAAKGIGPFAVLAALILVLGLGLRVAWFVPWILSFWALLGTPLLVAMGAPPATRDRMAVLFLTLMATGLGRLIAEVRARPAPEEEPASANASSPNRKGH